MYAGSAYHLEDNEIERMLRRASSSPLSTGGSGQPEQFSAFHRGTGVSKIGSDADFSAASRLGAHLNDGATSSNAGTQQRPAPRGDQAASKGTASPMSASSGMVSSRFGSKNTGEPRKLASMALNKVSSDRY